ncbi:MAG: hypothetical protein K8S54_02640 [Spirochaetia bacterium]|nr:hypothetical protein [Spirochaetia bacterium]
MKKLLGSIPLLIFVASASLADEKKFNTEEREVAMYICRESMWPKMTERATQPLTTEKRESFCNCTVDGWEKGVTFPRLMLTFLEIGSDKVKKTDPAALKLIEPVAICGLRSGVLEDNDKPKVDM